MDRRFLVVLASSLVLATAISFVFYRLARQARSDERVEWRETVVAVAPLPVGAVIRPEMVRLQKFPAAGLPKGAFASTADVIDRAVLSGILPEEPIVEGRLAERGGGFGLSPLIPAGMRAVSVRVNDVVGVAGFALPGARVDVLVTGRPPEGGDSTTNTVLQDVAVLSAGHSIQPDPKGQAIAAQVVTLLVTPEDAETLTLAGSEGHLQLVLRNAADRGRSDPPGRGLRALYRIKSEPAPMNTVASTAPRPHRERPAPARRVPVIPAPAVSQDQVVVMHGSPVHPIKQSVATFAAGGAL